MQSKKVIELNGKRYDAQTGRFLGDSKTENIPVKAAAAAPAVVKTAAAKPAAKIVRNTVHNVDGVIRARRAPQSSLRPVTPASRIAVRRAALKKPSPANVNHVAVHTPQPAVTLMRTAVQKPGPGFKQQATIQGALQHIVPSLLQPKTSINSISPRRVERAKTIQRSELIKHHAGEEQALGIPVSVQDVPVREVPVEPKMPVAQQAIHEQTPIDIFEHAIKNAGNFRDAHAHKHYKKRARIHLATMTAGGFTLFVLLGLVIYQSTPGLQYKMASARAGVSAGMPNVAAAGYKLDGVAHPADNKVVVSFSTTDNSARYQLGEQPTNWSSGDLLQNIGSVTASGQPNYGTLHDGDTVIYRFGSTDATWVNNGTWYQLSGNRPISDEQVAALVSHL